MFTAIVLFAAEFATVVREDPITGEDLATFATVEDDNILALVCKPGSGSLDIRFVPDRYYGPSKSGGVFWHPRADSRFKKQDKPDKNSWNFSENYLTYNRPNGGAIGTIKHKARFLDRLANDDRLAIRYEARRGATKTVVFNYSVQSEELKSFIARCAPKRVIKYLNEWESVIAPPNIEE